MRLAPSREGTHWYHILETLCAYRLIDLGSEWRLHRDWFEKSAMAGFLIEDFSLVAKDSLYRVHDRLPDHKRDLFAHSRKRWDKLRKVVEREGQYLLRTNMSETDPEKLWSYYL